MWLFQKIKSLFGMNDSCEAMAKIIRKPVPKPNVPAVPAKPVIVQPIDHMLNDPTTPNLIKREPAPTVPTQNAFAVQGYKGGGFAQKTIQFQAAQAYATIAETINYINSQAERKIPHWPRTSTLGVFPRAGVDLNAFYDGRSLQFFYYSAPQIGGTMFTVDSTDIVSHECGHGILDSYRPDLWNVAFLETGAFHECFGDFAALMHALSHDEMLQSALQETSGDLSKSNVISRLAEQFGAALAKLDPAGRDKTCLRNAVNTFKYASPNTLPKNAPDNKLAAEVHSFSRVFTGALWDIFVLMYNDSKQQGAAPLVALKYARDLLCKYTIKAIQNCPVNAKFFAAMATTMLWTDVTLSNRKYHDRMRQIFINRKILALQVGMLSAPKCLNSEKIVRTHSTINLKLADVIVRAQGHDDNPLYDVELEIMAETAHFYDNSGNIVGVVHSSKEDGIEGAQDMIHYLHATHKYGSDHTTPWEVRDGKLIRTRSCCK